MARVNREALLQVLEATSGGIAKKEVVEQSSCFVFTEGRVLTYNGEIMVSAPTPLPEVEGAVPADTLLALLNKLTEDTLQVVVKDGSLKITAPRKRSSIRMEAEVTIPVAAVELPDTWVEMDPDFLEGVSIVQQCAGKDEGQFALTCIHLHNDFVEACDNFQMARYPVATGFDTPSLVRQTSLKHILGLGVNEVAETPGWVHFQNPAGLVVSCRRYVEDYPVLDAVLEVEGKPVHLPANLTEGVEKAEIFSSHNAEQNQVEVSMAPDKMKLRGEGPHGYYEEQKAVKYSGPKMKFIIAPALLVSLTGRASDCTLGTEKLCVDGGKYTYVTCLGAAE